MAFCTNCGKENADGGKFCMFCGASLGSMVNTVEAAPVAEPVAATPVEAVPAAEPVAATPVTAAPVTAAPVTAAPVTAAPVTAAPVAATPVTAAPVSGNSSYANNVNSNAQKTNGLCVAGLIVSIVSIFCCGATSFIGLVLSILGVIFASKNKQKGKGMAIAGIIISAIMTIVGIVALIFNSAWIEVLNDSGFDFSPSHTVSTRDYDDDDDDDDDWDDDDDDDYTYPTIATTTTSEDDYTYPTTTTTEETSSTTSGHAGALTSVGNSQTGVIDLTYGTWYEWREANGGWPKEVVASAQAYEMSSGSIITMLTYNTNVDPKTMANAAADKLYKDNCTGVEGATVRLGGYDAYQVYGLYPDNTYFVCWYFKGNDNYLHYVAVEFPKSEYSVFSMVENNYKLDK